MVKNPPANAGDIRDAGLIPGLGRSHGEGYGSPSTLVWTIPWTEEPGMLQYMGYQGIRYDLVTEHTHAHTHMHTHTCTHTLTHLTCTTHREGDLGRETKEQD